MCVSHRHVSITGHQMKHNSHDPPVIP